MFRRFGQLFIKKLQKVAHFVRNHEISSIWQKEATFRGNYHVSAFWSRFQQKVAKTGSFLEKAQKIIDLAKFSNFLSILPCLGVLVKFWPKTWKNWLISWESTKNHPFGQNFHLFEETTMFHRFGQVFTRKFRKVTNFVKKQENSSTWQKLATFRANYHVSAFWSTFQQKLSKSGSHREKARKIIDLEKIRDFSTKLPSFGVCVNLSAKSCKKWLISWKSTKNHRFGRNFQLSVETTMFRRFGQLFSINAQKVAHFVKNNEKSSIWPKVATFRGNYHVSAFWSAFQQKLSRLISWKKTKNHWFCQKLNFFEETTIFRRFGQLLSKDVEKLAHFVKKHEISSIWPKLPTFPSNHHVSSFWSSFQGKIAESGSLRENARKIIDFPKTCNFSRKEPCFGALVNFSAKSGSFREKARKIIDLAKTCNISRKLPCIAVFVNFSSKSCKKGFISRKRPWNHGFG